MNNITLRKIEERDISELTKLIYKLSEYEGIAEYCDISEEAYRTMLFREKCLFSLVAEEKEKIVGAATYYFYRISSLGGRRVLYLEDLFLLPTARNKGIGRKIMAELQQIAKEKQCLKIEWRCLKSNSPAIAFYDKIGARNDQDWLMYSIPSKNFNKGENQ